MFSFTQQRVFFDAGKSTKAQYCKQGNQIIFGNRDMGFAERI
jgi:hypothetical protein